MPLPSPTQHEQEELLNNGGTEVIVRGQEPSSKAPDRQRQDLPHHQRWFRDKGAMVGNITTGRRSGRRTALAWCSCGRGANNYNPCSIQIVYSLSDNSMCILCIEFIILIKIRVR